MMPIGPAIPRVQVLAIDGVDARSFAQAQFSSDVDALAPGRWQWNAWLSPQGRVRALMHLADVGDGVLLALLRGGAAEALVLGLRPYLLRKRVTLAARTLTGHASGPTGYGTAQRAGDSIVLGYGSRSLCLAPVAEAPVPDLETKWRREDIGQGWPNLPQGDPEFLPPALGLEHLGAVAFDKGCYPGQEIAARLHYRGGHKYRLYHLRSAASLPGARDTGPDGAGLRVLDSVTADGAADALAVGPLDLPDEISMSGSVWRVITRFKA